MNTGDLSSGPAKLAKAWQKLNAHWDDVTQVWHDPVSQQFQERFLAEWEPQIVSALERMRALAGMLHTAEHECDH